MNVFVTIKDGYEKKNLYIRYIKYIKYIKLSSSSSCLRLDKMVLQASLNSEVC